jgi:hypothetical protein
MSSTVTAATVAAASSTLFSVSLGLMLAVTVLVLLIKKEVLLNSDHPVAVRTRRILNAALVPLMLAFAFIATVNLLGFIA